MCPFLFTIFLIRGLLLLLSSLFIFLSSFFVSVFMMKYFTRRRLILVVVFLSLIHTTGFFGAVVFVIRVFHVVFVSLSFLLFWGWAVCLSFVFPPFLSQTQVACCFAIVFWPAAAAPRALFK